MKEVVVLGAVEWHLWSVRRADWTNPATLVSSWVLRSLLLVAGVASAASEDWQEGSVDGLW